MGTIKQIDYWKKLPGGGRQKAKTKAWYAVWQVGGKTKKKKIGTKEAARSALAKFEDAEARRKHGLADPAAEAAARNKPLADLLADYLAVLAARDTADEYRAHTRARLTRILTGCKWRVWADVDKDALAGFLGALRDTPRELPLTGAAKSNKKDGAGQGGAKRRTAPRGCGPATLNGYLRAAKGFTNWLADKFGTAAPLRKLKEYPEDVDVRRSPRVLTDAELGKLLTAAAGAKRKSGAAVWGQDRAMLYRLAAYSGLRAGELSDLTPAHFSLAASPPVVTVEAEDAKGKRTEPIPLPEHLVKTLAPWLAGRGAKERVFPGNWAKHKKQSQWLAADLKRAGVAGADDKGRRVTFHSLKRRYVTRLIQAGAKIHEVRRMARHKDVKTTLKHYTDENLKELGGIADRLPPV